MPKVIIGRRGGVVGEGGSRRRRHPGSDEENESLRDGHDDDDVVQIHFGDVDRVDRQNLVADVEQTRSLQRRFRRHSRDENAVFLSHAVAFADVKSWEE